MTEASILRKIAPYTRDIGDDCAIVKPPSPKHELLLTVDTVIEDVHFRRTDKPHGAGYKAIARSLSDIAAMGGEPLYCLVSLTLAPWVEERWIQSFYRGASSALRDTRATIVGGDISHAGQFAANVTICGQAAKGKALRRDGARVGDLLYVSGPVGGWKHRRRLVPRLAMGRALVGRASACIDISDSVSLDLHRLCLLSGVAAEIDSLPLLRGATIENALHDGEDYELLYTAPPRKHVPGIPIGHIVEGKPGAIRFQGKPLQPKGYDHASHRS